MSILDRLKLGDELYWEPRRLVFPGPWAGHIPFAFWIVKVLKPSLFVELGTHSGNSYSAFCQALATFGVSGKAFAVDTWKGDEHSGTYGEDVYADLVSFNRANYPAFSNLLRTTFDEAQPYFADGSIDLLHIDGMHTYEASLADFETWRPKLSERAVVLFHDTNVRERNFGVWRTWAELRGRYPGFEFDHSNGLGVLGVGPDMPPELAALFGADPEQSLLIRRAFARPAEILHQRSRIIELERELDAARAAVARASVPQPDPGPARLEAANHELAWSQSLVHALQNTVLARDALLQLRESEVLARDAMVRDANRRILVGQDDMRAWRRQFHEATAEKSHLEAHLQNARAETARAGEEIARLGGEASRLHGDVAHLAAEHELVLRSVYSSTSWRITKPLRAVMRLALRARHPRHRQPAAIEPQQPIGPTPALPPPAPVALADFPNKQADLKPIVRGLMSQRLDALLSSGGRLKLPRHAEPDVSILLILFNQAELSYACLASIAECALARSLGVEVIILDNGSTDRTGELLDRVDGATIIRSEENLHFLRGVNRASEEARGRHLLLLNNDAQLTPGSLEAAVTVLDADPSIGAVGGRLILPDGSLQEAGSIIWSDGTCLGYGRGRNADEPEFMFQRDVDYCSGAFLLTPRAVFERMKRFDLSFAPAYYEETDYCVRLWEQGLRVVYDPRIVTQHFEFGSSDSSSDAIALQQRNWRTFRLKHSIWLAAQYAPSDATDLAARSARTRPHRVLLIEDRVPHRELGSGYPRSNDIIRELDQGDAQVTLFPMFHHAETWEGVRRSLPMTVEVIIDGSANSLHRFLQARQGYYDLVIVSRPHNMQELARHLTEDAGLLGSAKLVYDAEAIFARRKAVQDKVLGREAPTTDTAEAVAEEISLTRFADAVVSVSDGERRVFLEHGVSPVYTLMYEMEPAPGAADFSERSDIVFLGATHDELSPNADSLRWFADEVLPELRSLLGFDVRLKVVGLTNAPSIAALDGIAFDLVGRVPDVQPYLDAARVVVVPTRFAAGIPHKVHQVAGAGVPIVTTELIADQLGWTPGEDLLATSAPRAFAEACAKLHSDPELWRKLRENAIERVRQDCSPIEFRKTIGSLLDLAEPRDRRQDILQSGLRDYEKATTAPRYAGRPAEDDFSMAVPFSYVPKRLPRSISAAAIIHVYYDDLAAEILSYLRNVPFPLDLFISTDTEEKKDRIAAVFEGWPHGKVDLRVVPNRGRDIAPKLIAFREVHDAYEYVLHLHSKASFHDRLLAPWRRFLFENLLGSPAVVHSIFEAFVRYPKVGMIASQHYEYIRRWLDWNGVFGEARRVASRLGTKLVPEQALDFPSGSMFWARSAALKPLLDLGITVEDFPEEGGQTDATLAHVIERMYFYSCEAAGYDWLKVVRPELLLDGRTAIDIGSESALERFMSERVVVLTGPATIKSRSEPPPLVPTLSPALQWTLQRPLELPSEAA